MRRKGFMKKGIAIVATVLTVFASTSTILAYEPFMSVDEDAIVVSDLGQFGAFLDDRGTDNCDFSISDTIFVYEDGTQVAVADEEAELYAICNHTMTSGYYHVHSSNGSGGCTVYVYNAQRCTKCGFLDVGSLDSTHTYTVCPH